MVTRYHSKYEAPAWYQEASLEIEKFRDVLPTGDAKNRLSLEPPALHPRHPNAAQVRADDGDATPLTE